MNTFLKKHLPIGLTVIMLATAGFFGYTYNTKTASAACGGGFSHCISITFPTSNIPSTQTNFTVDVATSTLTSLKTVSNGGEVTNANGYDITLWSSSNCTGTLNWENEIYTPTTGNIIDWVKIPSLSSSVATTIEMCWGNSSITTFQGGSTGSAWDSNYVGVYHLPNGSSLSSADSSASGNNGTASGVSATTGQIDGAGNFPNASSPDIDLGNPANLQITGQITLEAWVNMASFPDSLNTGPFGSSDYRYIIGKGYDGSTEAYFLRLQNQGSGIQLLVGSYNGTSPGATWTLSGSFTTGTWHHLVGTYDGTNWNLYFDGSSVASNAGIAPVSANEDAYIGATNILGTVCRWTDGYIDEARISNTGRSANWILTEYNNQSSPSTFTIFGSEQAGAGALPHAQVNVIKSIDIIKNSHVNIQ